MSHWGLYTLFLLYLFVRTAITKHHRLNILNHRHLFSHSPGSWESKIKVAAGSASSETSLSLTCRWHLLAISSRGPLCLYYLCPDIQYDSHWIKTHPYKFILLIHLFKGPISQYSHSLRYWGLRLQPMNSVGGVDKFSPFLGTEIDVFYMLLTQFGEFPEVNYAEDFNTPSSHLTNHLYIFIAEEKHHLLFISLLVFF